MELLAFWYLFPVAIVIAILAMSGGVSGSNFWLPVYTIWLGLEPKLAFWLSMITMLVGFGSGVTRNLMNKTINWRLAKLYAITSIPGALIGGVLAVYLNVKILLITFAVFVFFFGIHLLHKGLTGKDIDIPPHNKIFWWVGFIGGLLKGLIATGLAKMLVPCLVNHKDIKHHAEAVGTTVFLVFVVNVVAIFARIDTSLIESLSGQTSQLLSILLWVAPGVLIGGQIGPQIAKKISKRHLHTYVGALLIIVSGLISIRFFY